MWLLGTPEIGGTPAGGSAALLLGALLSTSPAPPFPKAEGRESMVSSPFTTETRRAETLNRSLTGAPGKQDAPAGENATLGPFRTWAGRSSLTSSLTWTSSEVPLSISNCLALTCPGGIRRPSEGSLGQRESLCDVKVALIPARCSSGSWPARPLRGPRASGYAAPLPPWLAAGRGGGGVPVVLLARPSQGGSRASEHVPPSPLWSWQTCSLTLSSPLDTA